MKKKGTLNMGVAGMLKKLPRATEASSASKKEAQKKLNSSRDMKTPVKSALGENKTKQRKTNSVDPKPKLNKSIGEVASKVLVQKASEGDKLREKIKDLEQKVVSLENKYEEVKAEKISVFEECDKEKEEWMKERNELLEVNQQLTKMIEEINKKIDIVKKTHE
eukprot:TRINITY_DN5157_c0_g1_i4.p2 TRINITY_DN5157_c0_g1~~TRINITY_DN5157_c0_g1_i4.p2  ORF type:complete len:164 (+),score=59.12 TRINITY_DN5157_c0_g1_i4:102-593(+)